MRRHVVRTFCIVTIKSAASTPLLVLGNYAIERIRHVGADVFVPVLVQGERAGCVLDEEVEQTSLVL